MEWGGRWKPLQYAVKKTFAPIVVTFSGVLTSNAVELWSVNDDLSDASVEYSLYMIPWVGSGDLTSDRLVAQGKQVVARGSSMKLNTFTYSDDILSAQGCKVSSCVLVVTSTSHVGDIVTSLPVVPYYMTTMKAASLGASSTPVITDVELISSNQVQFSLSVNTTSPFFFMELKDSPSPSAVPAGIHGDNAGWFSENNFLAVAGTEYSITYTSFQTISNTKEFLSRLQMRSYLDVKTTC